MRLFLSVLICIYCGSLVESTLLYGSIAHRAGGARFSFYTALVLSFLCLGTALVLLRERWETEIALQRAVAAFGCACGGFVFGAWVHKCAGSEEVSTRLTLISSVSSHGAVIVLAACLLRQYRVGWGDGFGFRNRVWLAVVLGAIAAVALWWLAGMLDGAMLWVVRKLPRLGVEPKVQEAVQAIEQAGAWPSRLALVVMAVVLAPVGEELLFRGLLYPAIKQAGFPRLALWVTSLLFAAVHANLVIFLPLLVLALALTLIYEWTDNLLAPIVTHGVFNALNLVPLFLGK